MSSPVKRPERKAFGKYTLMAKLAKGGMGEIYLARLQGVAGFEKLVVIKRILPHLADHDRYITMLLDEARIAARLSHPNVCQVHELDEVDGEYYIAMEYLEGVSLAELLRRMAKLQAFLDPRIAVAILSQACEGLHAAHELVDRHGNPTNLVHRDISLSNVFITAAGPVKLLDFGIAKTPDKESQTRTDAVKGKWAYMSPEQILRQTLDRRSDIFSVGVVAFEALTGRRLFRRKSEYEICQAITETDAPSIQLFRPELPEDLARVVSKALGRRRDQRFASASELSRAFGRSIAALGGPAGMSEIAELVSSHFALELAERRRFVRSMDAPEHIIGASEASGPLPMVPEVHTDTSVATSSGGIVIDFDSDVISVPEPRLPRRNSTVSWDLPGTMPSEQVALARQGRRASSPSQKQARYPDSDSDQPMAKKPARWGLRLAVVLLVVGLAAGGAFAYVRVLRPVAGVTPSLTPSVDVESGAFHPEEELADAGADARASAEGSGDRDGAAPSVSGDAGHSGDEGPDSGPDDDPGRKRPDRKPSLEAQRRRDPAGFYAARVKDRSNQLQSCVDTHLRGDPSPPRTLMLMMKIDRRGRVTSTQIEPGAYDSAPIGRCLARVVTRIDFGKHESEIKVGVPIRPEPRR